MKLPWKLIPSLTTLLSGFATIALHGSPEVTALIAPSLGQMAAGLVPSQRTRESVIIDEANHSNRARSYEEFGGVVAAIWLQSGILMTFRPKLLGYLHGLLLLMRSQRRLEEQMALSAAALGNVLLYGSSETQQAAIDLFNALSGKLIELGSAGPQGSPKVRDFYDKASLDIGDKVVIWRAAAQEDLATPMSR